MKRNLYIGHDSQICGVEEHRLIGGKGDGMRLLQVRNGRGLELTVSLDRCGDISRLSFEGCNYGYFSPCGYVGPAYYDDRGTGFLKSFTAGFLTTCGLSSVGVPCTDEGEEFPLHGTVANCPSEWSSWEQTEEEILIKAKISQMQIFASKLVLNREIHCSTCKNEIFIQDTIENQGSETAPVLILYHMNMGYPLLSEKSRLLISSEKVRPRNEHAAKDLETWDVMLPPQKGFEEQCYYHSCEKKGLAVLYNEEIKKGVAIQFDPRSLNYFTQWKMMGERDYVLGLEPGNCHPDGRDVMRRNNCLQMLDPGDELRYNVQVSAFSGDEAFRDWHLNCSG